MREAVSFDCHGVGFLQPTAANTGQLNATRIKLFNLCIDFFFSPGNTFARF